MGGVTAAAASLVGATAIVGGMKVSNIGVVFGLRLNVPSLDGRRSVRLGFANVSGGCVLFVYDVSRGCDRRSFGRCRRLGDIGRHGGVRRGRRFRSLSP